MSTQQIIPLTPIRTWPGKAEYVEILGWPFPEHPFFLGQIKRLLQIDIPLRIMSSYCMAWAYRHPNGNTAGFGSIAVCKDYQQFTDGKLHTYIPLLAVNPAPDFARRGHGHSIVQHLIAEAVLIAQSARDFLSDILFLDVYVANQPAISLYDKCSFIALNSTNPILDPQENNEPYIVMAKKVTVSPAP